MIELKTYHLPRSTETQAFWNEDHYLITKVATLAYRFFVENFAIFVINQGAKVNNFFKADETPEALEPQEPLPPSFTPNFIPLIEKSVEKAVLGSLFWRVVKSVFGYAVPLTEKLDQCGTHASFAWLNNLKQLELKHFALFSAAVPLTYSLVQAVRKQPADLPLTEKLKNVAKEQFSAPHAVFYGSILALSLSNPLYGRALGLTSKDGFDASGHVMLKTALAPIVGAALSQAAVTNPNAATIGTMVYTFSDGVFISNTVRLCHTAMESVAGYVWGLGIVATSAALANTFVWLNQPNVAQYKKS